MELLTESGHDAWFVGGCVRNSLMGLPISDIDITTDALPTAVLALAQEHGHKAVATGIDHGTITLIIEDTPFEVTTLRRDVSTDGRRAAVSFSKSLLEDARRRDFTMNAVYALPDGTVVDPLNGLPDIKARRVRFIDDPYARIKEDYLRILRFFRFSSVYGNLERDGIDPDGLAACAELGEGLETLSKERIWQELSKILQDDDPSIALSTMIRAGLLWRILPGADSAQVSLLVHNERLVGAEPDAIRRLALIGGDDPAARLRLSRKEHRELVRYLVEDTSPRALGYRHGAKAAQDILLVRASAEGVEIDSKKLESAMRAATETFPLTADDLMPALTGPALGRALNAAEDEWIESGFTLTKEDLLG